MSTLGLLCSIIAGLQTSSVETLAFVAKQTWESEVATNGPPMKTGENTKCLTILFSVCGHMLKLHEERCHLEKLLSICFY